MTSSITLAERRSEYANVELELSYYRLDLLTTALVFFLLSFVLVALSWLAAPTRMALPKVIAVIQVLSLALLITAITMRCIIRSRPPVSTLYETILLITAGCVIVSLFIEWINLVFLTFVIHKGGRRIFGNAVIISQPRAL